MINVTGFVVIVVTKNNGYDCVLKNKIYPTHDDAKEAIRIEKLLDAKKGWSYEYEITSVTLDD
jgi:hypothetical protein